MCHRKDWRYVGSNFQPNVYISHIGTNDLATDITPEEISEKIITFSKHLKSEIRKVVVSGTAPRGDSYKEKAEAVNKLLKDACTEKICILFVTVTLILSGT